MTKRVVDGVLGTAFLQTLVEFLKNPALIFALERDKVMAESRPCHTGWHLADAFDGKENAWYMVRTK